MESESRETGSRLRVVILTVLRYVFICMSTPIVRGVSGRYEDVTKMTKRTSDSPVDDRSVLELDGDGLVVQFHQEPDVTNQRK